MPQFPQRQRVSPPLPSYLQEHGEMIAQYGSEGGIRRAALSCPGFHFLFWPTGRTHLFFLTTFPLSSLPPTPSPACLCRYFFSLSTVPIVLLHRYVPSSSPPSKAPTATWKFLFEGNLWPYCVLGVGGQGRSWLCFLSYCKAPRNVWTPKKPGFLCPGLNPFPSLPLPMAPRLVSSLPHLTIPI